MPLNYHYRKLNETKTQQMQEDCNPIKHTLDQHVITAELASLKEIETTEETSSAKDSFKSFCSTA